MRVKKIIEREKKKKKEKKQKSIMLGKYSTGEYISQKMKNEYLFFFFLLILAHLVLGLVAVSPGLLVPRCLEATPEPFLPRSVRSGESPAPSSTHVPEGKEDKLII